MFEKFTGNNARDFAQRYNQTFGYFTREGKDVLVQLSRVVIDSSPPRVEFIDKDGTTYCLYADNKDDSVGFKFIPPINRYHATKSGPLLVKRIPAKQYSRGICDRNTSIVGVRGQQFPVTFDVLLKCFNQEISYQNLFQQASTGKNDLNPIRGFCLSPFFAGSFYKGRIYCLGQIIGDFYASTGKIELHDPALFFTEVKDAIARSGIEGLSLS